MVSVPAFPSMTSTPVPPVIVSLPDHPQSETTVYRFAVMATVELAVQSIAPVAAEASTVASIVDVILFVVVTSAPPVIVKVVRSPAVSVVITVSSAAVFPEIVIVSSSAAVRFQ